MPAIQAMRSDALALRAKEDVQEKIPSFFNSVNQALGQNIITGQDNAEQLLDARFKAANALSAQIRQKVDGQGALSEMTAGLGMKLISQALDVVLAVLSKTTTTDAVEVISDIANFMLEQQTLQYQWKAIGATYAQWTVQAGYTGHGDFLDPASTGPGSYTVTVSQWLESSASGVPASQKPGGGSYPPQAGPGGQLSMLEGRTFTTTTYSDPQNLVQNIPNDLEVYKYQTRNWEDKPAETIHFYDDDGDPGTPEVADPGNPPTPIVAPASVTIDANNNNLWGDSGDQGSTVYYSPSQDKFYVKYNFTPPATSYPGPGTYSLNIPHNTLSISSGQSGFDMQIHNSGNDYANSNDFDTNYATLDANGDGILDYDLNRDGVVNAFDATVDNDGDGTIANGQYTDVGTTNGVDDNNNGTIDEPAEAGLAMQYNPGTDIDDILPQSSAMLTYIRTGPTGTSGSHNISFTISDAPTAPYSIGGRGALKYRDAYTPRFTDRNYYTNSTTGWGGGQSYDHYYNWGSVGSITRVGQYP